MNTAQQVGSRIKRLRKYRGMTQAELAKDANLTSQAIGNYERGTRKVTADMVTSLCKALNVPVWLVLEGIPEEAKNTNYDLEFFADADAQQMDEYNHDVSMDAEYDFYNKIEDAKSEVHTYVEVLDRVAKVSDLERLLNFTRSDKQNIINRMRLERIKNGDDVKKVIDLDPFAEREKAHDEAIKKRNHIFVRSFHTPINDLHTQIENLENTDIDTLRKNLTDIQNQLIDEENKRTY